MSGAGHLMGRQLGAVVSGVPLAASAELGLSSLSVFQNFYSSFSVLNKRCPSIFSKWRKSIQNKTVNIFKISFGFIIFPRHFIFSSFFFFSRKKKSIAGQSKNLWKRCWLGAGESSGRGRETAWRSTAGPAASRRRARSGPLSTLF